MILPNLPRDLVLASESPRRKMLLELIGLHPIIAPSHIEEHWNHEHHPAEGAQRFALQKAEKALQSYPNAIILGADTIVILDNHVLGKPKDEQEGRKMLMQLSGNWHTVITAIALVAESQGDIVRIVAHEQSQVHFRAIDAELLDRYIKTNEYADKAGSYGIQGYGAVIVQEIKGCYFNVMGLPLALFYDKMLEMLEIIQD